MEVKTPTIQPLGEHQHHNNRPTYCACNNRCGSQVWSPRPLPIIINLPTFGYGGPVLVPPHPHPRRNEVDSGGLVFLMTPAAISVPWDVHLTFIAQRLRLHKKCSGWCCGATTLDAGWRKTSSHGQASHLHTQRMPDRAWRRLFHCSQHQGSPVLDWASLVSTTHHLSCTPAPPLPNVFRARAFNMERTYQPH